MSTARKQPALAAIRAERYNLRSASNVIGVPYHHLRHAAHGTVRPNNRVRAELPKLLGVPLEDLFDADMLDKPNLADLGFKFGASK